MAIFISLPPKSNFGLAFGTVPGLSVGGVAPGLKLSDPLPLYMSKRKHILCLQIVSVIFTSIQYI